MPRLKKVGQKSADFIKWAPKVKQRTEFANRNFKYNKKGSLSEDKWYQGAEQKEYLTGADWSQWKGEAVGRREPLTRASRSVKARRDQSRDGEWLRECLWEIPRHDGF